MGTSRPRTRPPRLRPRHAGRHLTPSERWHAVDTIRHLPDGAVHVWRIELSSSPAIIAAGRRLLSDEESIRAAAYSSAAHADRFIAARVELRCLLGRYLNVAPEAVPLWAERHHKPRLEAAMSQRDLRFNMTHTNDLALVAVAAGVEVGVDLEGGRDSANRRALERTVLSHAELTALGGLSTAQRHEAVLRSWVRREAVLKGIGSGLRIPPSQLDVGDLRERAYGALVTAADRTWTLWDLTPWEASVAAVAAEGDTFEVGCFAVPQRRFFRPSAAM